jgi:chromosome segregation ATPase
MNWN